MSAVLRHGANGGSIDDGVRAVVFDLDGVLYRSTRLLDGSAALVDRLRANGVPLAFLTNGSTLDEDGVRRRCRGLGLNVGDAPVVTAVDAVTDLLGETYPNGATVLTICADPLRWAITGDGRHRIAAQGAAPTSIDSVVVGLDPVFDYAAGAGAGAGAGAAAAIRAGAGFVTTNADGVRPTDQGLQPETGAICAFLTAATGVTPIVAGKPSPRPFELVARALGVPVRSLLMVGDNLDTDVLGAAGVGARSALVLTGVATAQASRAADPAPTFVFDDLLALDRALPTIGIPLLIGDAAFP